MSGSGPAAEQLNGGQKILKYDIGTLLAEFLLAAPCSLLLFWLLWQSEPHQPLIVYVGLGLATAGAWVHAFFLWRSPATIIIDGDTITASWRGGTRRSWKSDEIRLRQPTTWLARSLGATEFVNLRGEVEFRVWKEIVGFSELERLTREA
jgi:hypothetical protein